MPVCSGSFTFCRCTTLGACSSSWRSSVPSIGPLPSSGSPSGSTTRPRKPSPTGTDSTSPVRRDPLALVDLAEVAEDHDADLAHVEVEREAAGAVLELQQLVGHGRGQARDPRDAVAALGDGADLLGGGRVRLVRLDKLG